MCECWTVPSVTGSAAEANISGVLRAFTCIYKLNYTINMLNGVAFLSAEHVISGQDVQQQLCTPSSKYLSLTSLEQVRHTICSHN